MNPPSPPAGRRPTWRRPRSPHAAATLAAALAVVAVAGPAVAQSPFPPPIHQTRLVVSYDPETRLVTGTERLRWRNDSVVAVPDLWFHHYLNAFANERSTFMRESGGQLRGVEFAEREWGWIEVESLTLADGTDLKPVEEYVAPDDGNPYDRTVARYPLPRPVPAGGWIEMEIAFTAKLPEIFARTGAHGEYVLAGQWFPKIAVFEDAGEGGAPEPGWNAHQFHAHSEFFADFGDYDVTLTLPERYRGKIGATGRRVAESVADGSVTERYQARGVHDFAWTAFPRFEVVRGRFDPAADVPAELLARVSATLGTTPAELALSPVDVEIFMQPANLSQADRYLAAAKAAIRGYGLRLGAYPYPTLTVVDPPLGGYGSGGMEYPTFITAGTHPLLAVPGFRRMMFPEVVTVHEFGHQFFQGMIASNEFEESWIDEGINSYYENVVMEEAFGPHTVRFLGLEVPLWESIRNGALEADGYADPVVRPAWGYLGGRSYGQSSYDRPALLLRHLEALLGRETFHRAMRHFFQTHRFSHPTTEDFTRAIEESSGVELDWFFDQALRSTRTLDYAIDSVGSRRQREPDGVFWVDGVRVDPSEEDDEEGADAAAAGGEAGTESGTGTAGLEGGTASAEPEGSPRGFLSHVAVIRRGEFVHPVEVAFYFADGREVRREWDGRARWARWTIRSPSRLAGAEVDPDRRMALDLDRLNNSRTIRPDRGPVAAFVADVLFLVQWVFAALGVLA